jgi:nicotinamide-nucleotide amidase
MRRARLGAADRTGSRHADPCRDGDLLGIPPSAHPPANRSIVPQPAPRLQAAGLPPRRPGGPARVTGRRAGPRQHLEWPAEPRRPRMAVMNGLGAAEAWVTRLAVALTARGWTVATAESCTGGLVGMLLTTQPGSSAYYRGGVIAYANHAKESLLAVPADVLERHGAVSAEVAMAMAAGARTGLCADLAVSLTGIAGPGGGSADKPVGLVYVGLATRRGVASRRLMLPGDRAAVRAGAAEAALAWLVDTAEAGD